MGRVPVELPLGRATNTTTGAVTAPISVLNVPILSGIGRSSGGPVVANQRPLLRLELMRAASSCGRPWKLVVASELRFRND